MSVVGDIFVVRVAGNVIGGAGVSVKGRSNMRSRN